MTNPLKCSHGWKTWIWYASVVYIQGISLEYTYNFFHVPCIYLIWILSQGIYIFYTFWCQVYLMYIYELYLKVMYIRTLIIIYMYIPCLYLLLLFFYRKITLRLVPKVGDWSCRARAAHRCQWPGFDTHACRPALRRLQGFAMCMFADLLVGYVSKNTPRAAAGTDKSSSQSRPELPGSRNWEHYWPGQALAACHVEIFRIRRWPLVPLSRPYHI